jgi:heptosyltransferase-2
MKAGRAVENLLIGAITLIHVGLCRLRFGQRAFAPADSAAETAPILVVRCEAKIGDNLLHIPFLRALRATYPGRKIHLLHHVASRSIYQHCPYVDERMEIAWPMSAPATLLRRLSLCAEFFAERAPHTRYGLAVLPRWDEDLYAPFLAWMSGAPRIVGFSRRVLPEKAWRNLGTDLLLTDAVNDTSVQHESRRSKQLLERLASPLPDSSWQLEFWFSDEDQRKVSLLQGADSPPDIGWLALAPGAAIDRRKWPIARFAEVAQALSRWPQIRLMILGTAGESGDCETVVRACAPGAALNLAGQLSLAQTAAAIAKCRLFIGNDSGLLHLACAVRTPALEISCHPIGAGDLHANSPARFGPTGEPAVVLRPQHPLSSSCRLGCCSDHAHCITAISINSVIQESQSLIDMQELAIAIHTPGRAHEQDQHLGR